MKLDEVIASLETRLKDGMVVDDELRKKVIRQYEDATLEGIPGDAVIRVLFEKPRSEKKLRKQLRKIDALARSRWDMGLPDDFIRLHTDYGCPAVTICWEDDDEDEGTGCAFSRATEILRSPWLTEPAWAETHPDGSNHEIFHPLVPFMDAESSEPVAFGFRHTPPQPAPSIEWVIPDCFEQTEAGLVFPGSSEKIEFSAWLNRWFEEGFPLHGPD